MVDGVKIRESLTQAKIALNEVEPYIPQLKNAFEVLPSVLGYQKEKTYLIWFQNDKELRPTGGFITAYGIAKIKNGKLLDVTSDDIYKLDKKFIPFEEPPELLKKYLFLKIYTLIDSNMSPYFKVSAQKFESYYEKIPNQPTLDVIIILKT